MFMHVMTLLKVAESFVPRARRSERATMIRRAGKSREMTPCPMRQWSGRMPNKVAMYDVLMLVGCMAHKHLLESIRFIKVKENSVHIGRYDSGFEEQLL